MAALVGGKICLGLLLNFFIDFLFDNIPMFAKLGKI